MISMYSMKSSTSRAKTVRKFLDFLENLFSRRHIALPPLGHQGHIQAFYYGLKAFRKQSIGFSQTTGLGKRGVLEVVWFNPHVCRNMVSNHAEPLSLLIGELLPSALLLP